jgi:hypothetical protein
MSGASENRSLATLVGELTEQGGTLLRTEAKLLRAEISEKLAKAGASAIEVLVAQFVCWQL